MLPAPALERIDGILDDHGPVTRPVPAPLRTRHLETITARCRLARNRLERLLDSRRIVLEVGHMPVEPRLAFENHTLYGLRPAVLVPHLGDDNAADDDGPHGDGRVGRNRDGGRNDDGRADWDGVNQVDVRLLVVDSAQVVTPSANRRPTRGRTRHDAGGPNRRGLLRRVAGRQRDDLLRTELGNNRQTRIDGQNLPRGPTGDGGHVGDRSARPDRIRPGAVLRRKRRFGRRGLDDLGRRTREGHNGDQGQPRQPAGERTNHRQYEVVDHTSPPRCVLGLIAYLPIDQEERWQAKKPGEDGTVPDAPGYAWPQ